MSKKNYIKSLNTKYSKNFAKFYSASSNNSTSNPYYWFNINGENEKKIDIKNLIQGWKCVLQKNGYGLCLTCESKKLECGMHVKIVASIRHPVSEYWMSVVSTKINQAIEEDVLIDISIRSGSKNIENSMEMLFFSSYGAGISFSSKDHNKIFDIMMNIKGYVDKIKSRIIMENMSDGK